MHTGFAAVASTDEWLEAVKTGQPLSSDTIYLSNQRAIQAR